MQSETLAQEFARLVKEYHEGDDHTKPEAWNLLADFAVDNADAISDALSDKQAVEVSCIACEGRPRAGNNPCAVCGRSALVDVPAVEPVGYTTQWNLDEVRAGRLGTIAPADTMRPENEIPLYTSPPLSREGEDSAEVERLRDALERISDGYGPNHLSAFCRNTSREALAATRSASATTAKGCDHG